MTDDLEAGPHSLQHLGNVVAEFAQLAAAVGAGSMRGHVGVYLAWKMLRQRAAERLRVNRALCRSSGLQFFNGNGRL
jgi:hypothetical protein